MSVIATAGHVDHGKSTLVAALTGMEPDRWAEEKERGLTIDLGFVWTRLPSGRDLAFVDVPGHERFLGNMLAGVGPVRAVCLVIAADEGWQQQTTDHCAALLSLGIRHVLIALTRCDRASAAHREEVIANIRRRLGDTLLSQAPILSVSAVSGEGMDELRHALDALLDRAENEEPADPDGPIRLWLDRSFSITGAGTVVTGTLGAGTLRRGDTLLHCGADGHPREVSIRGLHSENEAQPAILPPARAAVNLRGIGSDEVHRGDALLSPGDWLLRREVDVEVCPHALAAVEDARDLPGTLMAHLGTRQDEVHCRPLGSRHARLRWPAPLPLRLGDRVILRAAGDHAVAAGVQVVDLFPPELVRRGDGRRRAEELQRHPGVPGGRRLVEAAGILLREDCRRMGVPTAQCPPGVRAVGPWWASAQWLRGRAGMLSEKVKALDALSPGLLLGEAASVLGVSDQELVRAVAQEAGLEIHEGRVREPGRRIDLGPAERGIATIEEWLAEEPFRAPDAGELRDLGLSPAQLAAAERAGRIIRLGQDKSVVLLASAPEKAVAILRGLGGEFTLSEARRALDTTRRVAVPLLEFLDTQRLTRRVDATRRRVLGG